MGPNLYFNVHKFKVSNGLSSFSADNRFKQCLTKQVLNKLKNHREWGIKLSDRQRINIHIFRAKGVKTHQKKQMSYIFINESLIISAWVKKNHLVAIIA